VLTLYDKPSESDGMGDGDESSLGGLERKGCYESRKFRIKLAAPTGRAAKRLSESTHYYATTIHRLLEFDPKIGGFKHNENRPLLCDLLIIDESSMLDVFLMFALLKALPPAATLVLVGDVDQIPSIGPGQVLSDIISSGIVYTTHLNKIFRQVANSSIVVSAHLVNKGMMPRLSYKSLSSEDMRTDTNTRGVDISGVVNGDSVAKTKYVTDFLFYEVQDAEGAMRMILNLMQVEIPSLVCSGKVSIFGSSNEAAHGAQSSFQVKRDVQVLSPMQKGGVGAKALNIELQKILNATFNADCVEMYGQSYGVHDKVMQIENNYDKLIFNGDIGYIQTIDREERLIVVDFDGREVVYDFSELEQLVLAYAITIHKSQGSEYPIIVVPILTQHFVMLNRNLLYTAITRGKNLVVLVGQKKAIAMAVGNTSSSERYTKLKDFLLGKH
jgi:exodeoxyribonuclease V alpha subunit